METTEENKKLEIKLVEWFDDHWYKIIYEVDGKETTEYIPSVTTKLGVIAKPFLARWRGDVGNREADMRVFESQERGTRIHHAWYTMATKGCVVYQPPRHPNFNPEELKALDDEYSGNVALMRYQDEMYDLCKLRAWVELVDPVFMHSELTVYSLTQKDAGTVDNVIRIKEGEYPVNGRKPLLLPEGLYVADLKSGKTVDLDAYMQTAAYAKCVEEMGLGEVMGTLILHTGAKTKTGIEGLATLYRNKEQMAQDYEDYRLASALWERKNADAKPKVFEFPAMLTIKKEQDNG